MAVVVNSRNTSKESGLTDVEMGPLVGQTSMGSDSNSRAHLDINRVKSSGSVGSSTVMSTPKLTRAPLSKVLSALFLYSFSSVGMVLVNKSLSSSYNHNFDGDINILVLIFQAMTAVISVHLSKQMGLVDYPPFNINTAKQWAPVNIIFCLMLFTGMGSLKYNSVPMVTIFKNVTNIFTTAGDHYFFGTQIEFLVVVAFGVMLIGAVAAAWNDISISFLGLFWMSANCVCTAAYVLALKFATREIKLSKFGMVFYNNVLCTCFLLPAALLMGQVRVFFSTSEIHTFDYFIKNLFAGFVGFFLNFASLNCVAVTGPTTYAIVGSLNKIPTTILGWIIFDSRITPQTWFFITVSMCGGFIYSYAKITESRKKVRQSSTN